MDETSDFLLLKIILVGDALVGKTCILQRYVDHSFHHSYVSTIGIDFKVKTLHLNDKFIKLQIWDTAGQERFHTISTRYFRGAHGLLIIYDITNSVSFDNVVGWMKDVDANAGEDVDRIILGNKCDLEEKRIVSKEKGEKLAWEHGVRFFETSAKDNVNIEKAFLALVQDIMNKNYICGQRTDVVNLKKTEKKKCCSR
ncbi:ras-related protein Rab-10-like [Acipenser oxyrinchus oxyrinchus]|uniref:Ras-related protein Rab-1 n=1 Tax=Acipenser oxyrinchus oxyrinchus TaxID=40147 RepID=A0AAD8LR75_ACIOX|nr:ras-related protein Rab-10-like [Acipenser oxyrinchus oxyrinchus]